MKKKQLFIFVLIVFFSSFDGQHSPISVSAQTNNELFDGTITPKSKIQPKRRSARNTRWLKSKSASKIADNRAPKASTVLASGRTVNSIGKGVSNALVTVLGSTGKTFYGRTNPFGYFIVSEIDAGETYIFQVKHKRYIFAPQVLNVTEDVIGMNLIAEP